MTRPSEAGLREAYGFYVQMGTQAMTIRGIDVTEVDALHHLVKVQWRSLNRKTTGEEVIIDFDVTYLTQTRAGEQPKIFAFISGDEMAAFREHGLLRDHAASMKPPIWRFQSLA